MRLAPGIALALCTGLIAAPAHSVVVRHDTDPALYRANAANIPALVDMPESGQGVLIAPEWVLTVAHTVVWRTDDLASVTIGGRERAVAQVIVHPDYTEPPGPAPDGSIKPIMDGSFAMRDIALVRLREPVTDIAPVQLFEGPIEEGDILTLFGKGQGGTGLTGALSIYPQRGILRRARNEVAEVLPNWIGIRFDRGAEALTDEGSIGRGDSGGPWMIDEAGEMRVVALGSWSYWDGAPEDFQAGAYGLTTYHTRVAAYRDWIEATIAGA